MNTKAAGIICIVLAVLVGAFLWMRAPHSVGGNRAAIDKQEIMQMIGAMSPGDLSTLQAVLQQETDAVVGTSKGSANDQFYSKMQKVGFATAVETKQDIPLETAALLKNAKFFTLTPEGKDFLKDLMGKPVKTIETIPVTPDLIDRVQEKETSGQ